MKCFFKRLYRMQESGGIALEFAFILPLFIALCLPVVDYGRYMLMNQNLVKISSMMGDAVTMSTPIATDTMQKNVDADGLYLTRDALAAIVDSFGTQMLPFPQEQAGGEDLYQAVLTQVYRDSGGQPAIGWQYDLNSHNFYDSARQSLVGVVSSSNDIGMLANIPDILSSNLDDGENLVVTEVSAFYRPITPMLTALNVPFLGERWIRYTSYYRARYGDLTCVWPQKPPAPCPPAPS